MSDQLELPIEHLSLLSQKAERIRKGRRRHERDRYKRRNDPKKSSPEQFMSFRKTRLVANRRYCAKKCGVEFTITKEDLVWPTHCPALGVKLDYLTRGRSTPYQPSLDRVDPSKGYIPGNVVVISFRANSLKSDATFDELLKLSNYVSNALAESNGHAPRGKILLFPDKSTG